MKALAFLIVLLALPWSVQAQSHRFVDTTGHPPPQIDSIYTGPTFEVYYIDTVGWRVIKRDSVSVFPDSIPIDCWECIESYRMTIHRAPIIDTIIIAHFRTDAETTKIRKWRVGEK